MFPKRPIPVAALRFAVAMLTIVSADFVRAVTVDEAIAFIANRVELYMADQGQTDLAIQAFTGPAGANVKRVEQGIREKLIKNNKVKIQDNPLLATWTMKGSLSVDPDAATTLFKINVDLLDANGNRLTGFDKLFEDGKGATEGPGQSIPKESTPAATGASPEAPKPEVTVDRPSDAPSLVSVNADIQTKVENVSGQAADAPVADKKSIADQTKLKAQEIANQTIATAIKKPEFFRSPDVPSQISASKESKFLMEVHVSRSSAGPFQPISPQDLRGRAFIDLKEGDYFEIHVTNKNRFDAGVELLLDGINSMHFCENEGIRKSGKWLIKAGLTGVISGWFVRPGAAGMKRFLITSEPEGVAARLGQPQKIGSIQANFYMAYGENAPVPMFVALGPGGRGAITDGDPIDFNGAVEPRIFDKGFPLACISVLHMNPDPPRDLPPQ